jgi:hypothetical protein
MKQIFLAITLIGSSAHLTLAQRPSAEITSGGTTITEPGVYKLESLFHHADIVAVVKIVSGDTESYEIPIYKAEVLQTFKGTSTGRTIYFGPLAGQRLGWEYFVFLRSASGVLSAKSPSRDPYGGVHYSEIFDEGYSSMEASYQCVFDGQSISDKCDYGVRVCTDYIKLPKSIRTSPAAREDTDFGCRWVRRASFVSVLKSIEEQTTSKKPGSSPEAVP